MSEQSTVTAIDRQLMLRRFGPADSARNVFAFCAPAGTSLEWFATASNLDPLSRDVKAGDRLEVTTDDYAFFAEFFVLSSNPGFGIELAPLRGIDLRQATVGTRDSAPKNTTGIRAVYKGPSLKWCAVRPGKDGKEQTLKSEFQSEQACNTWIANHITNTEARR